MSSRNDCGYSFSFELPSEGLALRSVALEEDGTPTLIFDAALKVPTLTEEDVGIVCQLACDGRRPEFFYHMILPHHPFHGRQYKHHCPQWLRGTSIGELLAEVDWTMKCLNIGARSDREKEKFWSWKETSQLEGLADRLDFPCEKLGGKVIMSCDSVKVEKSENEMIFVEEPKMKITDDSNSTYTKYITDIYPSIAYYDEPLFLKVPELIKLILAAEWMKEKGVRFSRPWMKACSTPKQQTASQAVEVKPKALGEERVKDVMHNFLKQLPETSHQEVMTSLGPFFVETVVENTVMESGFEVKCTKTVVPSSISSPKVEETTIVRASSHDFNMVYASLDPNMPFTPEIPGQAQKIVPNVISWSELYSETVPWPQTWILPHNGEVTLSTTGGVSTSTIPVTETVARREATAVKVPVANEQLRVPAQKGYSKKRSKVSRKSVPQQQKVSRPASDVTSMTEQTLQNRMAAKSGTKRAYGYEDPGSGRRVACNEQGECIDNREGMRQCITQRQKLVPTDNNAQPTPRPLPLEQAAQLQARAAGATNDLFSPTGSTASIDSGFGSERHSLQPLPLQQAGATNNLFSPTGSVTSIDSSIGSERHSLQPPALPLQPASVTNNPLSPTGSVSTIDSGISNGSQSSEGSDEDSDATLEDGEN